TGVPVAHVFQRDARDISAEVPDPVFSTDPPYYDNINYAVVSDFLYVWLRTNLSAVWPDELATELTPKCVEIVANTYQFGSKEAARNHFEDRMSQVLATAARSHNAAYPMTVFYAFKQSETDAEGQASTGWEVFLQSLIAAGVQIEATWPIDTEMASR